jgi:hypothetical protein
MQDLTSKDTTISQVEIRALAQRLTGQFIQPGDRDYDQARAVWNGMIDRYPALIARCASRDDVGWTVNLCATTTSCCRSAVRPQRGRLCHQ